MRPFQAAAKITKLPMALAMRCEGENAGGLRQLPAVWRWIARMRRILSSRLAKKGRARGRNLPAGCSGLGGPRIWPCAQPGSFLCGEGWQPGEAWPEGRMARRMVASDGMSWVRDGCAPTGVSRVLYCPSSDNSQGSKESPGKIPKAKYYGNRGCRSLGVSCPA